MLLAPELIMPELEAPTDGTYEELLEGHDWETHLPPSPEGRLIRTADYCPCCEASVHFLLGPEGVAILAARFTVPAAAPGQQPPTRLFLLEHDRMERKNPEACRQALRELNPGPGPAWSVPVSQDGQPRWEEKHQPLEPQLAPAFPDILRQHQWKQHQKQRRDGAREAEYIHECALCRARMHVYLDRPGRPGDRSRTPVSRPFSLSQPFRVDAYLKAPQQPIKPATRPFCGALTAHCVSGPESMVVMSTLWGWPPPSGDPKRRRSTKMSENVDPQLLQQKVQTAPAGDFLFLSVQHAFHLPRRAF